jgi:hypothetical protein
MTIQEKNIQIAEMLGWGKGMLGEFTRPDTKANKEGMINIIPPFGLKFDIDANWQFEAIDFVEKQGYIVTSYQNTCEIESSDGDYSESNNCMVGQSYYEISGGKERKEVIFEALFQFSQYLKQKK